MGFPTNYTAALFKKKPKDWKEQAIQEVTRCAALGNSFHAVGVACLLDLWLWSSQVRTDPLGAKTIVSGWHETMHIPLVDDFSINDGEETVLELNAADMEEEEKVLELDLSSKRVEWLRLASHHGVPQERDKIPKKMGLEGGSVLPMEPKRTYKWPGAEGHLEVFGMEGTKQHLPLAQVPSPERQSNLFGSLRKREELEPNHQQNPFCLALNLYPLWGWIASRLNPADGPSRPDAAEQDN